MVRRPLTPSAAYLARCRDALGGFLAANVLEIRQDTDFARKVRFRPRQRLQALEVIDQREEVRGGQNFDVFSGPGGLRPTLVGTNEALADGIGADGGGQCPRHGADGTIERQFSNSGVARNRIGRDRLHRRHHGERNGEIEMAAFLRQIGGREVDGDVLEGETQPHGMERIVDTLAALSHRLIGQSDNGESPSPWRDANLHLDSAGLDPNERKRGNLPVHDAPLSLQKLIRTRKAIKNKCGTSTPNYEWAHPSVFPAMRLTFGQRECQSI